MSTKCKIVESSLSSVQPLFFSLLSIMRDIVSSFGGSQLHLIVMDPVIDVPKYIESQYYLENLNFKRGSWGKKKFLWKVFKEIPEQLPVFLGFFSFLFSFLFLYSFSFSFLSHPRILLGLFLYKQLQKIGHWGH